MEVSRHRGVLLLVAAVTGQAAANGRELMGFTIANVPDPMDTTAAPGAATTPAFGFNVDNSLQAAMLKQHVQAIGSQTLPPFQDFGQILGRSWASILVLLAMDVGVTFFLVQASYLAARNGWYGQPTSEPERLKSEQRFNISLGVIAGLAIAGGILILCFGMTQQAEPVYKQMQDLQFATGGLIAGAWNAVVHPPPVTTTLSPAKMRIATAAMKQASDAMKEVREVKAQLRHALEQLAAEKKQTQQVQQASQASGEEPPPAPAAPVPFAKVSSLQQKLAALKRTAKAKAAQALPSVPTAAPTLEDGYGGGAAAGGYGAAAPAPAAMSPCGTTTPPAVAAPAPPPVPQVLNYMPPLGCNCKAAYGAGLSYEGHCWKYKGLYNDQPVCVLQDPMCGGSTQDAGLGNGDVVVTCMVAEQDGGVPYQVELDRSTGSIHLGIDIAPDTSLQHLTITKVSGGLVEIWNSAHPEAIIKPGDLITKVNGQSGSSITLTQQLVMKQMLHITISRQNGWPMLASSGSAAPAPDPNSFDSGDCTKEGHGWGAVSICLSNAAPFPKGSSLWHCPWESMMLMSTKAFGGCNAIKIDCTGTNWRAVTSLYQKHDNNKTHPPEGSLETVEYAHKCVMHQCQNGPDPGPGFWVAGVSVSPWVGVANPCGKAGCERLYSQTKLVGAFGSAALAFPASVVIAMSLAGFALLFLRAHRAAHQRNAAHGHMLLLPIEGFHDEIDQEADVQVVEDIE